MILLGELDPSNVPACVGLLLLVGIVASLWAGALDVINHLVLRGILLATRATPRHYPQLLDQAVDLILMRKVGGGYIFMHRLLQEHFASRDDHAIEERNDVMQDAR
jgi:hypothetical protein